MIKVELTEQEAELFKLFRQSQYIFEAMQEEGVFELQAGKVTLNFNDKTLMNIEVMKRRQVIHTQ